MARELQQTIAMSVRGSIIASTVVALLAAATSAHAEAPLGAPLTAEAVVGYAQAHRSEIEAARAKAVAAGEMPKVVSALPDPMIMASIDHLPFQMLAENGVNWSVMAQQDFPLSGVLGAQRRVAEASAVAVSADAGRVVLDVDAEALSAFMMRVEVERMQVLVDEQIVVAKEVAATTQARVAAGDGAAADVLRAQTDLTLLEGERKALDGERASADAMLNAALGRAVDAPISAPSFTTPTTEPSPLPVLVSLALAKRPEIAAMRANVTAASANVDVMESMYAPMAFVRVGTARTMEMGQGAMLMVGVSIPLWREKLSAGVNEAKSMRAMADAEVAAMKNMTQGEVGAARGEVIAARTRWSTAHDGVVPLAQKTVALTLASYGGGQVMLVTVLDAVRALREARMQEIVAEIRLARAWIKLERTVGVVGVGPL